jgi:hypothetical protein
MERDIALKRPATVIAGRTVHRASQVRIGGATLNEVGRKATFLYRAGRIEPDYVLHKAEDGSWYANMTLKPERTWWQKNRARVITFGTLAALLLAALYFLVVTLLHVLTVLAPYLIGFLIVVSVIGLGLGHRIINITQNVSVK